MRKKRKRFVESSRPKRNAHSAVRPETEAIAPTKPNHMSDKHYNSDMRVICDVDSLKQWIDSTNSKMFGVCQYFIGQKCEQYPQDVFKSGDIDLTNFFLCLDSDQNKIHKHIMDIDSDDNNIGKGIIVKSVNEDYCSGKRVFILFEDLYKNELSGINIISNIEYLCNQFKRISHYAVDGICIKSKQNVSPGVYTIINFKM